MNNIVIISGGSGNDALVKGLKKIYKDVNVSVITNAYDNGKSTGVCRAVTDTLGVSDIRKNHTRMYKAMYDDVDERLLEFYDKRYSFEKNNEVKEICDLLDKWNLSNLKQYCINFFKNKTAYDYKYEDFSVANIIYAQMYKELGYEYTNKYFCDLLGLDDFVILNSFDNVFIEAVTSSGRLLTDEGDIVEYKNADDPIIKLNYVGDKANCKFGLNSKAIDAVLNADLIIISTGTFWSSIYPTIEYKDFYKYINKSTAKKIWAMDNNEDKDAYGVSSNDFIRIMEDCGLNLKDFTILENLDAVESLRLPNPNYKIVYESMGNNNGKHDGNLYAKAILKIYYNLINKKFDKIVSDFDDTIWARDYDNSEKLYNYSKSNIELLNSFKEKACIISGNTIDSIREKLYRVFGTDLNGLDLDIWADANSTLYRNNNKVDFIESANLDIDLPIILNKFENKFNIKFDKICAANYKIKNLSELERDLLVANLNNVFDAICINALAIKAGKTTVDIVSRYNNKSIVITNTNLNNCSTLYIGDEIDLGNDKDIARECTQSICTSGVEETNAILNLLKDSM